MIDTMKGLLIVDDSPIVRGALRTFFRGSGEYRVCGEAENGDEAIAKASELHPDCVVMDLAMSGTNGLDAARRIKWLLPRMPIVMFSFNSDAFQKFARKRNVIDAVASKVEGAAGLMRVLRRLLPLGGRQLSSNAA